MRYSGIGGQAVMEGVMMRNGDTYAVAVRKPDREIIVDVKKYNGPRQDSVWKKIPLVRGVVSFVDSLVLGMSTLMYSATFFEEEEEQPKENLSEEEQIKMEKKEKREEKAFMTGTLLLSIVIAVAIFIILPYFISELLQRVIPRQTLISIIEGILRLLIFVVYILLISRMEDIQRTFMYHGAEHKCINCIEHGLELTVENVRKSSKEHKRCGTSFLMYVIIISIILFLFIRMDSHVLRLVVRLLLIPVIAGISYEFIRLAGRSDKKIVNVLSKPGLMMQRLTTKEPTDDMIEVGIASVEAVFDWRAYQEEIRAEDPEAFEGEGPFK